MLQCIVEFDKHLKMLAQSEKMELKRYKFEMKKSSEELEWVELNRDAFPGQNKKVANG